MAVEAAVDREALQATAVAVVAEATTAVAVDAPVVVTAGIGNPSRRLKRFLPSGSRSCSQFLEPSFRAARTFSEPPHLFSSLIRGAIFFFANLKTGLRAASGAMLGGVQSIEL